MAMLFVDLKRSDRRRDLLDQGKSLFQINLIRAVEQFL